MKCISCEVEINPKWKHAVDINVCPFCGQCIMEEHLKNLLTSLRETMDKLQEYPEQVSDWLLSNHNYIKTDSPNLVSYLDKDTIKDLKKYEDEKDFQERKEKKFKVTVQTEAGEQEIDAEKVQSEEKTNDFFKRAEAVKPNIDGFNSTKEKTEQLKAKKAEHLNKLKNQIQREGEEVVNRRGASANNGAGEADPEAVALFQSLISDGDGISSSLPDSSDGGDDEIPSIVLNMAKRKGGGSSVDELDLINKMQDRVNQSKRNFHTGSKGSFSRG
jgi:hypothetical protein